MELTLSHIGALRLILNFRNRTLSGRCYVNKVVLDFVFIKVIVQIEHVSTRGLMDKASDF